MRPRPTPEERARRRRLRLAVYGGLAIVLAVAGFVTWRLGQPLATGPDSDWGDIDWANLREVDLLRRYVQIDTSRDGGRELAGAELLRQILEPTGAEVHIERLDGQRANLWAILEGEEPEAVVLHHHIDVSPIGDPAAWFYPPFEARLDPPWIYGRGVFDMKSLAVAHLAAFLDLAASGVRPRRSVILLATADEEYGSHLGTRWILSQHPELTRRFGVVLTEGGVVEAVNRSEIKYWGIEFAQQRLIQIEACSGSRERLEELRGDLAERSASLARLRASAPLRDFLASYAESRSWEWNRRLLADPDNLALNPTRFVKIPPYVQSMFRNEVFSYEIEQDPEVGYRVRIHLQLVPGADPQAAVAEMLPPWMTAGVSLEIGPALGSDGASPADHPAFSALAETVQQRYPGTPVGPYLLSWRATDARFFRASGIPAFGFSPFLVLSPDTLQVDAPNERIALPGFVEGVELFSAALRRLAS